MSRSVLAPHALVALLALIVAACGQSAATTPDAGPTCTDGIKNGGESGVDCGGTSSCGPCANGQTCTSASDCSSDACVSGSCAAPSCSDGVKDGDETGTDCGGSCGACAPGQGCGKSGDCQSGVCSGTPATCQAPTCTDGVKNGGESGVDCGGTSSCPKCGDGKACGQDSDCAAPAICTDGLCAAPSCSDGVKDGQETATDCGGPSCKPCSTGQTCVQGADCTSLVCNGSPAVCQPGSCGDGVKNGGESGIDCGGTSSCIRCGAGLGCTQPSDCASALCGPGGVCVVPTGASCVRDSDCQSGFCGVNGTCAPDSCHDGKIDVGESGIDCGGTSSCGGCPGAACTGTAEGSCGPPYFCGAGTCSTSGCRDGVQDEGEEAVDCGGTSTCGGCATQACEGAGEGNCAYGLYCAQGTCGSDSCHDGAQDNGETGVDCGINSQCGACATEACTGTGQGSCVAGLYCANGICGSDSCHDGVQDNGEDGVDCGGTSTCGHCLAEACTGTGQGNCISSLYCEQTTHLCGTDPCHDGAQDVGETGIDCGVHSACGACQGETCANSGQGSCVAGLYCEQPTHLCGTDPCFDGVQDRGEEGIDCGGTSTCGKCAGDACSGLGAGNCLAALYCEQNTHVCGTDPCFDGVKDNGEENIDCGGTGNSCGKCSGDACSGTGAGNCLSSLYCEQNTHTCGTNPCFDGVKDQGEENIDCGGASQCGKCLGDACSGTGSGTGSGTCLSTLYCEQPTLTCGSDPCFDGAKDEGEENTDCGGNSACGKCSGDACTGTGHGNCLSTLYCAKGACGTDSCHDGAQDNGETGVDCGGNCGGCSGAACTNNGTGQGTCATGFFCTTGQCGTDACHDGFSDNGETGVDCGGSCGGCSGAACTGTGHGSCASAYYCAGGVCGTNECSDGAKDGNESDIDCGGSCSTKCAMGKQCNTDADCAVGLCSLNASTGTNTCSLGTGGASALNVASGTSVTLATAATNCSGASGSNTLNVGSTTGFSANAASSIVFIHQTRGTGAGTWQLNRITSLGTNTFTLSNPLNFNYAGVAQVIAVPQYTTVTIAGTLFAPAWNETTGGILPFLATGAVTITGQINASGAGFRGGGWPTNGCITHPACSGTELQGQAGESTSGPVIAPGPTGSGNNGANNGSGGGAGSTGQDCAMGGGGGYGTSGTTGMAGSVGTCAPNPHGGGLGGNATGVADLTSQLDLGSGGGQGGLDEDGALAGVGGYGGGAVAIWASSLSVSGAIVSNGGTGGTGVNTASCPGFTGSGGGMGNGGGGSGGAIMVFTSGAASIGSGLLQALGGPGGNGGSCGQAGAGGSGRIGVHALGGVTGASNPPSN